MQYFKRFLVEKCTILAVIVVLSSPVLALDTNIVGTNVTSPTIPQIAAMYEKLGLDETTHITYATTPSLSTPFASGTLTQESQQSGLNALNFTRYIAGLSYDITLDDEYITLAQDGALMNALNRQMSHYPTQPNDVDTMLFESGALGCSSSNLATTTSGSGYFDGIKRNFYYDMMHLWMSDEDVSNITTVGHRRWVLNPTMERSGFGWVDRYEVPYQSYRTMYAIDSAFAETDIHGVLWPAQTMPLSCFGNDYPWSYSAGGPLNQDNIAVTLTHIADNVSWFFSNAQSDGFFTVNNDYYGQSGCIIFRPDNISYHPDDVFQVTISGDVTANYFVTFFDLEGTSVPAMTDSALQPSATPVSYLPADTSITQNYLDGASPWAVDSIVRARNLDIVDDSLLTDYDASITRAEFCSLSLNYYEALGGILPTGTLQHYFTDTSDYRIISAYTLGIISGTSQTQFSPNSTINREQLAVMLHGVLKHFPVIDIQGDLSQFSDIDDISPWAVESVSLLHALGMMSGTSLDTISPHATTTREQAIVMVMSGLS